MSENCFQKVLSFEEIEKRQQSERERIKNLVLCGSKEELRAELEWQKAFVRNVKWQPQPRSQRNFSD